MNPDMEKAFSAELIRFVSSLILLAITWGGSKWLLNGWELKKKAREIDLTIATQFQQLFGEFKEIWRLWRLSQQPSNKGLAPPSIRWDLLTRATSAEGQVEAVLLKLATDRSLNVEELNTLGLFRQSFQVLREGIRDGNTMRFTHKHPRYMLFNKLGAEVTHIILNNSRNARPTSTQAYKAFQTIINVRSNDLESAEKEFAKQAEAIIEEYP